MNLRQLTLTPLEMYKLWQEIMEYEEIKPVSLEELHAINEAYRKNGDELIKEDIEDIEAAQQWIREMIDEYENDGKCWRD
jgi:inorganic pyrophosphatase